MFLLTAQLPHKNRRGDSESLCGPIKDNSYFEEPINKAIYLSGIPGVRNIKEVPFVIFIIMVMVAYMEMTNNTFTLYD